MNNQDDNVGVSPYVPSARKSIHNHESCIFPDCAEMGRYGIPPRPTSPVRPTATGSPSYQDRGTDEVDNVMSKFTQQTSPVPVRSKKQDQRKERRNSFHNSDPEVSDDSEQESDLLAKSLPANLPSYNCSSDSDFFVPQYNITSSDSGTERKLSNDYNLGSNSTSTSFNEYVEEHQTRQSRKTCQPVLITLTVAIVSIAIFYSIDLFNLTQGTNNVYDGSQFRKDMNDLGEKYKIQDNSLLEVQSGISTILARNDTGSFIFVYNEKSDKFNNLQFSNFVQEIASVAAHYLRNDTMYNRPTVLHSSDLNVQSHSELMSKYRHEVAKTGVMLVKDVDKIPSSLAMAFHYFCDEYNPLVAKSAIFFTLNLANCSDYSEQKTTHSNVEKCLANVWSAVPKDNIKPLLARVVSVVIDVTDGW